MKVTLLSYTSDPELVIAGAAKLCYSSSDCETLFENLDEENSKTFVEMLTTMGHASPLEHAVFTFGIDGVSRACTHQLVRHRLASFNQKSQRYVDENNFEFVEPELIKENKYAHEYFEYAMEDDNFYYTKIKDALIDSGIDTKIAQENARSVLPNACTSSIIVTMNVRELLHFFEVRTCNRAQDEIRAVADEMLKLCYGVSHTLFANAGCPCIRCECPEGKMSCGRGYEKKQHIEDLKRQAE